MEEAKHYRFDIKTDHFNSLESGSLPWASKFFMNILKSMYNDGILTIKPTEAKAYIEEYPDDREPKLVIDYTLV